MKRVYFSALIACIGFILVACGNQNALTDEKLDAKTKNYFAQLQSNNIDLVLGFYSKEFFNLHPIQVWRNRLNALFEKFGPVDRIVIINKQADTRFSGKFYIYQYYTVHGEKRIKHVLTWILPVDGEEIKLVGHMIKEPRT